METPFTAPPLSQSQIQGLGRRFENVNDAALQCGNRIRENKKTTPTPRWPVLTTATAIPVALTNLPRISERLQRGFERIPQILVNLTIGSCLTTFTGELLRTAIPKAVNRYRTYTERNKLARQVAAWAASEHVDI